MDWKNVIERATWTFVEAFILALPSAYSLGLDGGAWKAALFAAACAGISALKTVIIDAVRKRLAELKESKTEQEELSDGSEEPESESEDGKDESEK